MALYRPCHLVSNDPSNQQRLFWCSRNKAGKSGLNDACVSNDLARAEYLTEVKYNYVISRKMTWSHIKSDSQEEGTSLISVLWPSRFFFFWPIISHRAPSYSLFASLVCIKVHREGAAKSLLLFTGSLPLSIRPPVRLWGMTEGVSETRCPGFSGSCQDWGLGDTEPILVNRGASHHQLAGNTIW